MPAAPAIAMLLLAFAIDRAWGEPPARWHPVVWMGRWLSWAGRRVAPAAASAAATNARGGPFLGGACAWLLGAAVVVALAWSAQALLLRAGGGWLVVGGAVLLKPLLAWRLLRDEVAAVERALGVSLAAGRGQLARLVSRDVAGLDAVAVRESAIESLAENFNDSVVAPVFWFLVGGLPGAALYRYANTADAMWGYRGMRDGRAWEWAGKFAARADDVLSWLPARISAALLALAAGGVGPRRLAREAARTPSPNSGWPMAAMALGLQVRLAKPGVYALNAGGDAPHPRHSARAQVLARRAVALLLVLASGALALRGALPW